MVREEYSAGVVFLYPFFITRACYAKGVIEWDIEMMSLRTEVSFER